MDAPELNADCPRARALAARARAFVAARLGATRLKAGRAVLREVRFGKFAGRVVARVETPDGGDLAAALVAAGLARPYGGGRRAAWCPELPGR